MTTGGITVTIDVGELTPVLESMLELLQWTKVAVELLKQSNDPRSINHALAAAPIGERIAATARKVEKDARDRVAESRENL